jgi:hypothetical protein
MRFAGRLTVAALLAVMVLAIVTSPEEVHRHYMAKYDQFRNMLYMLRVVDLPPSSYVQLHKTRLRVSSISFVTST